MWWLPMLQSWRQAKELEATAVPFKSEEDPLLVVWPPDDPLNPQNWPLLKKWAVTIEISAIAFVVGLAGSINSAADGYAAHKFGVSPEVIALQTGLFLIGFGVAAPAMGPMSELAGRNPVYLVSLAGFSAFCLGSGFAENIQTRVILRFFAGCFGASPLSNAGGSVADMAGQRQRTYLFPAFSAFGFVGPTIGPVFGGWLGERANQAWCDWVTAAAGFGLMFFLMIFMPETLGAELLKHRAIKLRKDTGQPYQTALERRLQSSGENFLVHVRRAISMPVVFLATEPITLCFSLYLTVVYVVLFGDFESFSIIFQVWDWSPGQTGSAFGAIVIGMIVCGLTIPLFYIHYKRLLLKFGNVPPEERLWTALIGSWLMPIGLFWGAWTCYKSISPWSFLVSQFVFGIGSLSCFISSYMYLIDVYQVNAASPLASLTFVRYIVAGAGSVMFTRPMYTNIGNHWAMSLLAFLAVVVSLIPIVFYFFGPQIRRRSQYAMAQ